MSRPMIASIISWLAALSLDTKLCATFAYCPSNYVELGHQIYSMSYIRPVTSSFSGWISDIKPRIVTIVGLGGECGLAQGAIEYLKATDVWASLPVGVEPSYDSASEGANAELLERTGNSRVIKYNPLDAFGCFRTIESLAFFRCWLRPADRLLLEQSRHSE